MENDMKESKNGPVAQCDERVACRNGVSLENLFTEQLCIPDYQRSFCWRKSNVVDLMETLWMRKEKEKEKEKGKEKVDTHLGTIILKQEKKADGARERLSIVDGQQRLLTLTILAFCLGSQKLPLLDAPLDGTSNEAKSAQKHLYWAQTTIKGWIKTRGVDEKECRAFLQNAMENVKFTVVTLPPAAPEDMAYTFFNAVNSSGKKLSDYDLLKAHHLRFIADEAIAKVMAERWDATGADCYGDILHKTLYRLRNWSRHDDPAVDAQIGHRLFNHFSAKAPTVGGIFFPPLAMRFNSTIPGGAPFFYYAERHRMLWDKFNKTDAYLALSHLTGHSGNVLRDIIRTLLFAFYCRFGEIYLK